MLKFFLINVDKMSKTGQFISYLLLGMLLFGTLSLVSVIAGEDVTIAWVSGTIAMVAWVVGLTIWLTRSKEAKQPEKESSTNPS